MFAQPEDWAGAMILSTGASTGFPDLGKVFEDDREPNVRGPCAASAVATFRLRTRTSTS